MNVTNYCDAMANELNDWKGRLDSVFRELDQAPCEHKEKVSPQVNEIQMIVVELQDRIETLRTECPEDWGTQKDEMDTKLGKVRGKMGNPQDDASRQAKRED